MVTLKYLHEMPVTWLHCIHLLYDKIAQIIPLCNTAILAACLKLQLATINNFKNRSWQNMRCHQTLNVILIGGNFVVMFVYCKGVVYLVFELLLI